MKEVARRGGLGLHVRLGGDADNPWQSVFGRQRSYATVAGSYILPLHQNFRLHMHYADPSSRISSSPSKMLGFPWSLQTTISYE